MNSTEVTTKKPYRKQRSLILLFICRCSFFEWYNEENNAYQ